MAPGAMNRWITSLSDAQPVPYWLEDPGKPHPEPALTGPETCDLLVVGGGYSGLWTALVAKEREPQRDVLLLEGREVGWAASGRNGGFCAASLTHGLPNGLARWPEEIHKLEELGARNLDEIEAAIARYGIDCDFERTGEIDVATETYQAWELRDWYEELEGKGSPTASSSSTPTQCASRSPRPPSRRVCTTAGAWPCSTPPSSPGA